VENAQKLVGPSSSIVGMPSCRRHMNREGSMKHP